MFPLVVVGVENIRVTFTGCCIHLATWTDIRFNRDSAIIVQDSVILTGSLCVTHFASRAPGDTDGKIKKKRGGKTHQPP